MRSSIAIASELHGDKFANALRCGIYRVIHEQETLNRINVFPVADGDTGTNLSLSLGSALDTLADPGRNHVGNLLVKIADALLDGARGNSGAIVAQFFQGMSDASVDLRRFTTETFAQAVATGSEYAHDALAKPRQGTILSVIAAFSSELRLNSTDGAFSANLRKALEKAEAALVRTEEQLDELRKAGVVDAGAKGFVALVDGMTDYLVDNVVAEEPDIAQMMVTETSETAGSKESLAYRFCTECIVTGDDIDRRKLREKLASLGDSLVLAGTKKKAKVHIHVNDPDAVFAVAREFGQLAGEKADDMQRQQHSAHNKKGRFAVITDSAADIADEDMEELDIHMVPLRVQFGDRGYLDKVSISTEEFFETLRCNPVHPTTSQPSPGDFRRQYQYLASHFEDVVAVSLTPEVSGTYQAAVTAASRPGLAGKVHVVNSLNASLGQGQLAVFAAECAAAGLDAETTLAAIARLVPVTVSYGLVRDLRYAVRGGRVPASRKWAADMLRITPVLRSESDGTISARGILFGKRNLLPKFARFIARRSSKTAELRLSIGHALCKDDAMELEQLIRQQLPNVGKSVILKLGSALGAHGGPGSIVVGVQEYRNPQEIR